MTTTVGTRIEISEIFQSIQGEGLYAGEPTIFVRFQGCDLACTYCDSKYTWKLSNGLSDNKFTAKEIKEKLLTYDKVTNHGVNWVCITGGEPLQQFNGFVDLVKVLKGFYKIEVETSGLVELPIGYTFSDVDSWVVDLKLPSSEVKATPIVKDLGRLRLKDQVKLVLETEEDFIYASTVLKTYPTEAKVLVSPKFGDDGQVDPKLLQACVDFSIVNGYRLSLQIHKYIWGMKRGV